MTPTVTKNKEGVLVATAANVAAVFNIPEAEIEGTEITRQDFETIMDHLNGTQIKIQYLQLFYRGRLDQLMVKSTELKRRWKIAIRKAQAC